MLYEQYDRLEADFSGKINTAAYAANHRKTNSYAAPSPECRVAHPRAPDGARGRTADRGGKAEPVRSPRRHDGPAGL